MRKVVFFIVIISILFSTNACDSSQVYEENIEIPNGLWNSGEPIGFKFIIEETSVPYNVYINVRNTNLYPTNNLWLFVTSISPSGKQQKDTVEFILADDKGQWYGSGMGDIWDHQLPFKNNIGFVEQGEYQIILQQGMRIENLPFVMETGVRIEKSELKK